MDFGIYWISLWILIIIIEVFISSLYFLVLSVAAFITWWIVILFDFWFDQWWIAWTIFLTIWILNILILIKFVFPWLKKNTSYYSEKNKKDIIGETIIVKKSNWKKIAYLEWNYWNLSSQEELHNWDQAKVIDYEMDTLKVEKTK